MTTFFSPTVGKSFTTRGATYTADAFGMIYGVPAGSFDAVDLLDSGCTPVLGLPDANFRNLIDGGDFTVNPWQRNIPGLASSNVIASAISNTLTYFPDRFFAVGGASSSILLSKVADTALPQFSSACKMQRSPSNTDTAALNFGQVLETADCVRAQGRQVTLSFYAKAGANYSGGPLTVVLASGTGTNQSAANLVAGTWTGQANVINSTATLSSLYQRFTFTGTVPTTATQLGVLPAWTPAGTAGSDDSVTFQGFQLEFGSVATPFEHRDIQVELEICQRYAWIIQEPANGVIVGAGTTLGANAQTFYMATPVQFRAAPSLSVVTGGFKVGAGAALATATISAGTTHTVNAISVTSAVTAAAGVGALLGGGGGSGYIAASADY